MTILQEGTRIRSIHWPGGDLVVADFDDIESITATTLKGPAGEMTMILVRKKDGSWQLYNPAYLEGITLEDQSKQPKYEEEGSPPEVPWDDEEVLSSWDDISDPPTLDDLIDEMRSAEIKVREILCSKLIRILPGWCTLSENQAEELVEEMTKLVLRGPKS